MSLNPVEGVGESAFQRADLSAIPGLNPRARMTLEGLPLDRDALSQTIDEVIAEVNKLDAAPFVVWQSADEQLTGTRAIADSNNVTLQADGANVKADLTDTGVTAGDYGDASHVIAITIDAKGRIVDAQAFPLESGNITETTKLFYTDARARAAMHAGTGLDYDATTGTFSLPNSGVSPGTYSPPASITVDAQGRVTAIS